MCLRNQIMDQRQANSLPFSSSTLAATSLKVVTRNKEMRMISFVSLFSRLEKQATDTARCTGDCVHLFRPCHPFYWQLRLRGKRKEVASDCRSPDDVRMLLIRVSLLVCSLRKIWEQGVCLPFSRSLFVAHAWVAGDPHENVSLSLSGAKVGHKVRP